MREAAYSEIGLPLRCEGDVVFLSTAPATGAEVYVAGEFNAWSPDADRLEPVVDGDDFRIARLSIADAEPGLYKFVFGDADFRADPWARRFGWDDNGEYSLTGRRLGASHIERWPMFEPVDEALFARDVTVYVPPMASDVPHPVIYMHDGQNLFNPDAVWGGWQAQATADLAIGGGLGPFIIVGLDNTPNRLEEYTHVPDDFGGGLVGGDADRYADFLVDEVVPFIEARYDVSTEPSERAVAGSSLGGLVSAHIVHHHRDVFGFAAVMSGTLGWGQIGADNPTMADVYAADPRTDVRFYVDSGGDGPCPGGSDNYCVTIEFADTLRLFGWVDGADLEVQWEPGALHNEAAWAARLGGVFEAWLSGG